MLNIRVKKVVFFIGAIMILFAIYQLSSSMLSNEYTKESFMIKDSEKSQKAERLNNLAVEAFSLNENVKHSDKGHQTKLSSPLFVGQKIVHIDMKGAPPKPTYFKDFFALIKNLGATGVLMEYEDMFPYSDTFISAANAYSKSDVKTILKVAAENNLDVIPLIQTFGHLEFVLKLDRYKQFREVPKYPQAICPTNNKTSPLLMRMIDDIVALHPNSHYLHIGCDEVYQLGECFQCMETMLKNNWTKQQLFFSHVTMVAGYVKQKYPKLTVMIWDDEFRKSSLQDLLDSNLGSLVEPVVWKYTPFVTTDLPEGMWDKYSKVFSSVWIASAFKGATGPDKLTTNISYHLDNHRAWMGLVKSLSKQINFKGIIITGWQRYDHFAILCELLPVGIPSLAVNLAFISQDDIEMDEVPQLVLEQLSCGPGLLHSSIGARCSFPGSVIYEKAHQLSALLDHISELREINEAKGWLTEYNIHIDFSNPVYVERATYDVNRYSMELQYIKDDLRKSMNDIYDEYTVKEWEYTNIRPAEMQLQTLWRARERLLGPNSWPRRPIVGEDRHDIDNNRK